MKNILSLLTLAALSGTLSAKPIVGTWFAKNTGESKSTIVLTFLANGTYLLAEDGNSKKDPSGQDGMERGTYKWNASTKAFSSKTLVDTNGKWGLSSGGIKSVSVSGKSLVLGGVKFKKIESTGNKLPGTWFLKTGDGYAAVTFLADGTYFMIQDGKGSSEEKSGVERGTYKWKASNKRLTTKVQVDTNGGWGFSNDYRRTVTVSKNRLTLKEAGVGTYTLSRVVTP